MNSMLKKPFNDTHRNEWECIEQLILLLSLFSCNTSKGAER